MKLPKTAKDWKGDDIKIEWPPKAKPIAKCGSVYLLQSGADKFHIVYGLEVKMAMDWCTAASQFGHSVMHQAACDGLLKHPAEY